MGFQPILVGQSPTLHNGIARRVGLCPTIALAEIREILISHYNNRLSQCHSGQTTFLVDWVAMDVEVGLGYLIYGIKDAIQ